MRSNKFVRNMKKIKITNSDNKGMYCRVRKFFASLFKAKLVILLCCSSVSAQTTEIRYLPINNSLLPFTFLVAPTSLSSVSVGGVMSYNMPVTTANISWTHVPDADQYKLELYNANTQQWNQIHVSTGALHILDNLSLGLQQFRVIACGGGLCGSPSGSASIMIEENLDLDLDGVVDLHDLCKSSVQGANVNAYGCVATPGVDSDDDEVDDDSDWCNGPTATSTALNTNGCTPDQIDSDGDGNADYLDSYPYQNDSQCTP